jgi:hypothetical protein
VGFLVEHQNQGGEGFLGLGIKIGFRNQNHRNSFLVWASKPRNLWFVG